MSYLKNTNSVAEMLQRSTLRRSDSICDDREDGKCLLKHTEPF